MLIEQGFQLMLPYHKLGEIYKSVKSGKIQAICICNKGIVRSSDWAVKLRNAGINAVYLEEGLEGIKESCLEKQNFFVETVANVPSVLIDLDLDEIFEFGELINQLDRKRDTPIIFTYTTSDIDIIPSVHRDLRKLK